MRHFHSIFPVLCLATLVLCCKKNDPAVEPALRIEDRSAMENAPGAALSFRISLDRAPGETVSVKVSTANLDAEAGKDYEALAGKIIQFSPGETEQYVFVQMLDERDIEADEKFEVRCTDPIGTTLGRPVAIGTIQNDDDADPYDIPLEGYSTPADYPGKTRVWADEFDGTSLNTTFWTHETGNGQGGWGNQELEYYRAENTILFNGHLVIEAKKETFNGFQYTSSRLKTQGKKSFQFGRMDIRAALPDGQGIWPALWMLGDNIPSAGWPACGEIDIMELVGHEPGTMHGTLHYGPTFPQHQYTGKRFDLPAGEKFSSKFHVFSIIWEQDRIQWLVDDVPFQEQTRASLGPVFPYPFNEPFFLIFNLAVGGQWPGSPDATTVFPKRMIVDYVRVFQ